MRIATTRALALAAVLAMASATPIMAQGHEGHHPADGERPTGMMHQMMQDCPMAEGQMMGDAMGPMMGHQMGQMMGHMMGPEALAEQADDLELTEEQVAELSRLQERFAELHTEMRGLMGSMHEVLTPEQREMMRSGAMNCPMMPSEGSGTGDGGR